jgi:hypothetical protein
MVQRQMMRRQGLSTNEGQFGEDRQESLRGGMMKITTAREGRIILYQLGYMDASPWKLGASGELWMTYAKAEYGGNVYAVAKREAHRIGTIAHG